MSNYFHIGVLYTLYITRRTQYVQQLPQNNTTILSISNQKKQQQPSGNLHTDDYINTQYRILTYISAFGCVSEAGLHFIPRAPDVLSLLQYVCTHITNL